MGKRWVPLGLAVAGLLAGCGESSSTRASDSPSEQRSRIVTAGALWVRPETVGELYRQPEAIARARVVAVDAGAPIPSTNPELPEGGRPPIPTQRVTFETIEAVAGDPGKRFEIFRTGGRMDDGTILQLEDDPPYRIGEEHLLFLLPGPHGMYIPFGPDGRASVTPEGRLSPVVADGPGASLQSTEVAGVRTQAEGVRDDA